MVFESLVADLLNRFLGDYVENLDKSQLKLGIWGGNVVLDNLKVQENALNDLDVPFKIKAGQIDKLTLKIPWKNLYSEAVVATLDGLHLLVVPEGSIEYDAEKEEKQLQENKQKELLRIEDALQKAAKKGRKHKKSKKYFKKSAKLRSKDKPKEEKKDTFGEKLATQIIKNLQIKITSIHVRYEDTVTDSSRPISVGVTLGELSLQTADENWTPCILSDAAKIIYKLVRLDCLCVYWNVNSSLFCPNSRQQILVQLKEGIASSAQEPKNHDYIFRPISASAKLCINPYAETELNSPKINLDMEVQSIDIEMTKPQYLSIIDLLESVDYMVRNIPYRRYKPNVPLHNNASKWWQYAISGILEVHVRRKYHMWSWDKIKSHRENLKAYKVAYKSKLTQTKLSEELLKQLQILEKSLDIFNITLARQQAHVEMIRSGHKMLGKKGTEKQSGGWFSGLWGRKESKKKGEEEDKSVPESINDLMTAEEKAKLYTAIGYSASSHNLTFPKEYVAHVISFKLVTTSITIREEPNVPAILNVQMVDLSTSVFQRPGAKGFKVEARLEHWYVTGLEQQNTVPSLMASVGGTESSLLSVCFEINPEGSNADQLLSVQSQPMELIYDAQTINSLVEFFQTNRGLDLEQLTSATLMKLEEIKEKTATGLSYVIETRKTFDLRINLKPSYLVLPQTGFYDINSNLMIVDFGSLQLNSVNHNDQKATTPSLSLEEILERAYEKFDVELRSVQLLFSRSGQDWKSARKECSSSQHILQPMDVKVQLSRAIVEKDARMPKFKVSGELPLLHVRMSDQKIRSVCELADSIPFPRSLSSSRSPIKAKMSLAAKSRKVFDPSLVVVGSSASLEADNSSSLESEEEFYDTKEEANLPSKLTMAAGDAPLYELQKEDIESLHEELTDLQLKFEVKEVVIELTRQEDQEKPLLVFSVSQLGTEVNIRAFDLTSTSYLKKITLDYCEVPDYQNQKLHLISCTDTGGSDLLKVEYIKADKNGPHFKMNYDSTEQMLKVTFSSLNFLLHTKALLSTINFLTTVVLAGNMGSIDKDHEAKAQKQDQDKGVPTKTVLKSSRDTDLVDFKMFAVMNAFNVAVCDEKCSIADIRVQGLDASVSMQSKQTEVFARLRDIVVTDVDSKTLHKKAVSIVGNEVFSFNIILYPNAIDGDNYADMSKVDGKVTLRVGCIQIIYLHTFVMSLLNFFDNFQAAKEALSAATGKAAEKAASSVKDFAQKSFRLAMDINLKAPVIIIPESSISMNALVADLGLITVQNRFTLIIDEGFSVPPVLDVMDVHLTQLKLSRTVLQTSSSQLDIQMLQPINLQLTVQRNLAAVWYLKIPSVEIKGHLKTMNIVLSEEDLTVLMKVLEQNLAEGSKKPGATKALKDEGKKKLKDPKEAAKSERIVASESSATDHLLEIMKGGMPNDVVNVQLNFEIKEVVVELTKQIEKQKRSFLMFHVVQLGTETQVRNYDLSATAYLKKIALNCCEFTDSNNKPLNLISSSDKPGADLLKVQYIKADRNGPHFKSTYNSTEQKMRVAFSSLDLILHSQALLSTMNFIAAVFPSSNVSKDREAKPSTDHEKETLTKEVSIDTAVDAFDLNFSAELGALNIFVCDEKFSIADIKIQGMDASISVQPKQTEVFARLKDIIVTDADSRTLHKKVVSIIGDEVFSFRMVLCCNATEGEDYLDMSKVDGDVTLQVGCIQLVYLHKFFMSLLNFFDNFQAAKEALSAATAQAAEKAASSVKDFAQKSFRLAMGINLKAPVIIIPESSISMNAVVADLGFITVQNKFTLISAEECALPPVVDIMEVQLTQLKLSRTILQKDSVQPDFQILQPVNMLLTIKRNLAIAWYHKIPGIEINGDLKAMNVTVSQDDLTILLKILLENFGEVTNDQNAAAESKEDTDKIDKIIVSGANLCEGCPQVKASDVAHVESKNKLEPYETLKFDFKFEALSLLLYIKNLKQPTGQLQRLESSHLGEFRLHLTTASGMMFTDGSLVFDMNLTTCTLDDLREGIGKVTQRMIEKKQGAQENVMIELKYNQTEDETSIITVLEHLYICASVEFLLDVADFFIKAMPEKSADKSVPLYSKQTGKAPHTSAIDSSRRKINVKVLVMNPEVVFVANLSKADAPSLVASFHCDFSFICEKQSQKIIALVSDLKVLACPFLQEKRGTNITTVLQPCSLFLEYFEPSSGPQNINLKVEAIIIKVSPIILNTVMTIMSAMTPKVQEVEMQQTNDMVTDLWAVKDAFNSNYWFLGVDMASEATDIFTEEKRGRTRESFKIDVSLIQVTLECGLGHCTIPLLLTESTFSGRVENWMSFVSVNSDMTLEVLYYNELSAVWEPLLEQVAGGLKRWSLTFQMKTNTGLDKALVPGDDFLLISEPQTAITISSKDILNITVSKCSLNVLNVLAKAFSAGTASTFDYSLKDKVPYTLKNALGIPLDVHHSTNLRAIGSPTDEKLHRLAVGQILELDYLTVQPRNRGKLSVLERQESNLFTLTVVPRDYTEVANIPVTKPGRRLYNVLRPGSKHSVSLLAQIDVVEGDKRIIIRSPLQIKNHFSVSFIVCKFVPDGQLLDPIGVANPEEEFHVPLDSYRGQLFLKPSGELDDQFKVSTTYITWKEELHRSTEIRCTLQCPSTEIGFLPLIVNTIAIPDELNFISNHGEDEWDPAYIIHLHPTVTMKNLLPYSLRYMLEATAEINELAEGCSTDILHSRIRGEIMELVLMKYQGRNWCGHIKIENGLPEIFPVCFTSDCKDRMSIDLLVHVRKVCGRLVLSVYSPYWIINKTSRVLQYRAEDVHVKHPAEFRDVVLFSFKRKNIFSKNKIQLCISTSSWSNGFSLDTVGSYGCVKCPAKNMGYLIGVTIKMSSFNMTKVVTLTPFYTLVNKSSYELEVGEDHPTGHLDSGKWIYISAAECLPFWPETSSNKLCVRVVGSEQSSKAFFYNKQDNGTLLSLEHVCGGIIVDVNVADHATVITFTDYYDGSAPALIINHTTAVKFRFKQCGLQDELILGPGEARLFAWADPAGIRKLNWGCVWKTGELDLLKDQFGQFLWEHNNQIHWVSFLDGRQRVLVFTEDVAVVSKARQAEDLTQFDKGITVSLHSLGLSLVNNESQQEIAYIGITSSGVVWEMKRKQRWRPFSQKHINLLEKAYQTYLKTQERWMKLDSNLEVNFQLMQTRLPQPLSIRRNFLSGIQVEYKQSAHHRSLRAQLYWLQVDNQLAGAIFPIAFHPVLPPKSIVLDSEPKPFVDISIITRFNEHSQVMQFKYFMVLIQEMAVKIDQGFLSAVIALFAPASDPQAVTQKTNLIDQDMEALKAELMETSMTDASRLSFFEYFHISPIKLHLSLSLDSGGDESSKEKQEAVPLQSLHILLKSIGATLTDVDDLIFKLAFYEIKFQFYKRDQLMWAVISHYSEQFLKQMYVLVLGLDVLGNPVGLIRGLSEGVEAFFYEPFQGAVQGPEEFAEGFVIGVRSLLGHTVGGAAGVVSRITGTVGKGLAAITMDKEYQQKRREEMNRQPKDFGDSLAKGGKGFLRGVVGGFTGIVTKPVEGAKKEGAAGFFKGVGKGLVGVVARPTGGIVDMASSTLQGIKKVAESTEDVNKLRPPRCIREDGIIRPYDRTESEGCHLFEKLDIQKFEGENYRIHCHLYGKKKVNLLITSRRVVCISDEILGHLGSDWNYTFEEFIQPPTLEGNVLSLYIKDQSIIGFSSPKSGTEGFVRKVPLEDENIAKRMIDTLEEAQAARQQQELVKRKSLRFSKP